MEKSKFKSELINYLRQRGVHEQMPGHVRCFDPAHNEKTGSCLIQDDHFHCFGCGIDGDIYDAVRIIENIPEFVDQFHFLEEFFEGKVIKPQIENSEPVEKEKFIPDANAEFKFEQYLN